MDIIFDSYLDAIGYDRKHAAELKKIGFYELTKYWKAFKPYGVEQIVSEPESAVIDLGGGHSIFEIAKIKSLTLSPNESSHDPK